VWVIMKEIRVPVKTLSEKDFEPYGKVIKKPAGAKPDLANEMIEYYDLDKLYGVNTMLNEPLGVSYFETPRRPLAFMLERHSLTPEILIPLTGLSILPVAPIDQKRRDSLPDPEEIRGFLLSESEAVLLKPGVWHFIPNSITECSRFIVIFRRGTAEEDLEIRDLGKELGVALKYDFSLF